MYSRWNLLMRIRPILLTLCLAVPMVLTGCKLFYDAHYKGEFHTQDGSCTDRGKLTIDSNDKELLLNFYCVMTSCLEKEGKLSQGGYFNIYAGSGQFIKGRVSPGKSRGEWQLKLDGEMCSGYWTAEEID